MLKKIMTYTDYNDVERTEEFCFNLSKAEVLEMQMTEYGGLDQTLRKIIDAKDNEKIVGYFKEIILKAYGEKSEDGRRLMKSPEISRAFSETEAFSDLYLELTMDTNAGIAFVQGIMPDISPEALSKFAGKSAGNAVATPVFPTALGPAT